MMEETKAQEKAAIKAATDKIDAFFTENPNARVCILQLDVDGNSKALSTALQHVTKKYQRAAYLFSVDETEGRVAHCNILPKSDVSKAFNAKQWLDGVTKILGGRGGGKDESAQGVGVEAAKVDEAVAQATEAYKQALGTV